MRVWIRLVARKLLVDFQIESLSSKTSKNHFHRVFELVTTPGITRKLGISKKGPQKA